MGCFGNSSKDRRVADSPKEPSKLNNDHGNLYPRRMPRILSVDPEYSPPEGGILLSVHGEGFSDDLVVVFGDTEARTTCPNANALVCIVPPSENGATDTTICIKSRSSPKSQSSLSYNRLLIRSKDCERPFRYLVPAAADTDSKQTHGSQHLNHDICKAPLEITMAKLEGRSSVPSTTSTDTAPPPPYNEEPEPDGACIHELNPKARKRLTPSRGIFHLQKHQSCQDVLLSALQAMGMPPDWRSYDLHVVLDDGETDRLVSLDERPFSLFALLETEGKNPVFVLKEHSLVPQQMSAATDKADETNETTNDDGTFPYFGSFRVASDTPCYKILPLALSKYFIVNDWREYELWISGRDRDFQLGLGARAVRLYNQLDEMGQRPRVVLRKRYKFSTNLSGTCADALVVVLEDEETVNTITGIVQKHIDWKSGVDANQSQPLSNAGYL